MIREPSRTSLSIWQSLGPPDHIKKALANLPSFRMIEQSWATFEITSLESDFSLPLLQTRIINNRPENPVAEYKYLIHLRRVGDYLIVSGKDVIAETVFGAINRNYKQLFAAELPVYSAHINLEKLVADHKDSVTKLHVQLKNTVGLSSMTLYGDDVTRSLVYRNMLEGATYLTAKLKNPFGQNGVTAEFNHRGTLGSDIVIDSDILIRIVQELRDEYWAA